MFRNHFNWKESILFNTAVFITKVSNPYNDFYLMIAFNNCMFLAILLSDV